MDGWIDGLMDGWMDRWMGGWMDGWMDGWMYGWMGGRMNGWMYGRTDGWMGLLSKGMSAEYPSSQETHLFSKTLTPLLFLHSPHNIPGDRETERDKAENNEFTCV